MALNPLESLNNTDLENKNHFMKNDTKVNCWHTGVHGCLVKFMGKTSDDIIFYYNRDFDFLDAAYLEIENEILVERFLKCLISRPFFIFFSILSLIMLCLNVYVFSRIIKYRSTEYNRMDLPEEEIEIEDVNEKEEI